MISRSRRSSDAVAGSGMATGIRMATVFGAVALIGLIGSAGCSSGQEPPEASERSVPNRSVDELPVLTVDRSDAWGDLSACPLGPERSVNSTAAPEPISGVREFGDPERSHVDGCVDYPMRPAVGGPHHEVWANCGFYASPVPDELVVHVLEHGGVAIAMEPSLGDRDLEAVLKMVDSSTHVIASPYPGLTSPIVLSAWNRQLELDSTSDPRFAEFMSTYLEGTTTPEPGAPCSGGEGTPL